MDYVTLLKSTPGEFLMPSGNWSYCSIIPGTYQVNSRSKRHVYIGKAERCRVKQEDTEQ